MHKSAGGKRVPDSERFRVALERIARLSLQASRAGDVACEMSKIARSALQDAGARTGDPDLQTIQSLILRLKKQTMTTTERLLQWRPQQCAFDELLELSAAARALRAEYSMRNLDAPAWLPKAESDLDAEICSRSQGERLCLPSEMNKQREVMHS
jgi:hypothetical protein